jgi:energy-coupling factor transporter transmembrane protein EcfT
MNLTENVGEKDRSIRLIIATLLIIASFLVGPFWLQMLLTVFALLLVFTTWMRLCPAYLPFGINTRRK